MYVGGDPNRGPNLVVDIPLVDDMGAFIISARGILYGNRSNAVIVNNQLLCSCISPIYFKLSTGSSVFVANSTYLLMSAGRIVNGFRYFDDQGDIGNTTRSGVMGGFVTFTTLKYRICLRSVTFYSSSTWLKSTILYPVIFGVYGTNDNVNFKQLSVINLTLVKSLYTPPGGSATGYTYIDNPNGIDGYVSASPFEVLDLNTGVSSFFYATPPGLAVDTKSTDPPRIFTFQNDVCYGAYMLKHLPQNVGLNTSTTLDTFSLYISEIEWG
jgi:hypothetical protein